MVAADAARVRELWEAPDQVSAADVPLLESLVAEYPAAVPLWWLYVRAVQRAEAPQFSQVLQRCSAVSPDRSALMAWVEAPLLPVAATDRPAAPAEPVAPARPAAPAAPAVEVPTVPVAAAPRAPKAPTVPVAAAPQAPVPAPKVVVPQAPAEVNLDALPEKVREQILRARALKAKLTQGSSQPEVPAAASHVSAEQAPKPSPGSATKSPRPAAVKPAAPPAPEAVAAPPAPEALRGGSEQESAPDLSPFARFVAQLAEQNRPKSEDLIDQFLTANPRISPVSKDAPVAEVRTQPDAQVTGLVTETLARMYAEQGHVAKAIQAYEILKLRVPEKSMIFAARIEALRNS